METKNQKVLLLKVKKVVSGPTGGASLYLTVDKKFYRGYVVSFYCSRNLEEEQAWYNFFTAKKENNESVPLKVNSKSGLAYAIHNSALLKCSK
jgi:hypothetical protein